MYSIKFRPSSHSASFTVVATYANAETAKKAQRELRGTRRGNTVIVSAHNVTRDEATEISNNVSRYNPTKANAYGTYQKLAIRVNIPKKVTLKTLPLILDPKTVDIINEIRKRCRRPKIEHLAKGDCIVFEYEGEQLYLEGATLPHSPGTFAFGEDDERKVPPEIKVRTIEEA